MQSLTRIVLTLLCFLLVQLAPATAQEDYFEVGPLNVGLGQPLEYLDRETPMGTIESFIFHADRGEYDVAAHLLDLSMLPEEEQTERGALLARYLDALLSRKVVIHWDRLADRPDGWLTGSTENQATGRVRRSIMIDVLDLGDHSVPLLVNRVKPENGSPVWVVSRQTVANLPNLYYRYGPTELEQSLPDWARQETESGMYVWEVIFIPLLIIAAVILAKATHQAIRVLGCRATTRLGHSVVRALRWPAVIIVTTAFVGFATRKVLIVSGIVDSIISPAVLFGYISGITLAAVLVIDELFDRVSRQGPEELADPENAHLRNIATTISGVRKFVIVIACLVVGGTVLTSANVFWSLGFSLLASAGALTIVLGFAAREVLGNILAAVQIALNRSARIGDQIIFDGRYCTVERIHFTYVQLLIWNGNRLIVPVSRFVEDAFENWSIEDVRMIRPIELVLSQTADVGAMRTVFFDALSRESDDDVGPRDKAAVNVISQDAFGKTARFEVPTCNPVTGWDVECRIREVLLAEATRLQREQDVEMLPAAEPREIAAE